MSNRFHNKFHRHNHHTTQKFPTEPDASHDPIASHAEPFYGDFVQQPGSGVLSARDIRTNVVTPFSGNWVYFPTNVFISSLSAISTVVTFENVLVSEASGVAYRGGDFGLTIPNGLGTIGSNNILLCGVALSSVTWGSFAGDFQTQRNLWVSGEGHFNNMYGSSAFIYNISARNNIYAGNDVLVGDDLFVADDVFVADDAVVSGCVVTDCVSALSCPTLDINCFQFNASTNLVEMNNDGGGLNFSSLTHWPVKDTIITISDQAVFQRVSALEYTRDFEFVRNIRMDNFNDVEGICWVSGNTFACIQEYSSIGYPAVSAPLSLFEIDAATTVIDFNSCRNYVVDISYVNNRGPEGITYDSNNNRFIIVREGTGSVADNANVPGISAIGVFAVPVNGGTATELFNTPNKLSAALLAIGNGTRLDLSDIFVDNQTQNLFLLSHEASAVLQTDFSGNIIASRSFNYFNQLEAIGCTQDMQTMYLGGEPNQIAKYDSYVGTVTLNGTYKVTNDLVVEDFLHAKGNVKIEGDTIAAGNFSVNDCLQTDCIRGNVIASAINVMHNLNMNGFSVSGIGNTSLAFESGAKLQSDSSGNIRLRGTSIAEGDSTTVNGSYSHAEGQGTAADGGGHAEGQNTGSFGPGAHAEGVSCLANEEASHAEGYNTFAYNIASHAEGIGTVVYGQGAHGEGNATAASAANSHAEGNATIASAPAAHAEGNTTVANGTNSHAEGVGTNSGGDNSHAEGGHTRTTSAYAHTEGYGTSATSTAAHAEGYQNLASGEYAHVEGYNSRSTHMASHAEGFSTIASNLGAHAEGSQTIASGSISHAEGFITEAAGEYSHSEGLQTGAIGLVSHAAGLRARAVHDYSYVWSSHFFPVSSTSPYQYKVSAVSGVVLGQGITAIGGLLNQGFLTNTGNVSVLGSLYVSGNLLGGFFPVAANTSFAYGFGVSALGQLSFAEGVYTKTTTLGAHAEGFQTIGGGAHSHVEGGYSSTTGAYSHAEGYNNIAGGVASHAEGSQTIASGDNSHAEGTGTIASGAGAHADGNNTRARGSNSEAHGLNAVAAHDRSYVWSSYSSPISTDSTDQFKVSALSGVTLGRNVLVQGDLTVIGNVILGGGGGGGGGPVEGVTLDSETTWTNQTIVTEVSSTGMFMTLTVNGSALAIQLYKY